MLHIFNVAVDMVLCECTMNSMIYVKPDICNITTHISVFTCFSQVHTGVKFPRIKSLCAACKEEISFPSRGWPIFHPTVPTPMLSRHYGSLSHSLVLPTRSSMANRSRMSPRASKDAASSFCYPQMTRKPRWWWRTLACIPYLISFHWAWTSAETAYYLHPFLEDFEFLTYPFLRALKRLPPWFLMAYFITAYLGVVKRKEWPHFFRFHVAMGMLLEITLEVMGTVSHWLPLSMYWGKFGMHFWTAAAFAYLFTLVECMRCAFVGMYAEVPFACDAAYIQMSFD
ncbi:protein TIC 20-I, chloroplastic-like isoform X2 [Macadamia integrifolia]|uniref:protein TIC 20-I, chloroplastic-like isoform X2 n=1 Tax=Macadamia integrifolia TaxID=60698 RepID=UPI001C4ED2C2|nr:protein TIC 20-I, chloroplastic-like isoform X2 [Macadamia integrifolia]